MLSLRRVAKTLGSRWYELRRESLVRPSGGFDPHVIPLPVLFDLQKLLKWFADNPGIGEYLDRRPESPRRFDSMRFLHTWLSRTTLRFFKTSLIA